MGRIKFMPVTALGLDVPMRIKVMGAQTLDDLSTGYYLMSENGRLTWWELQMLASMGSHPSWVGQDKSDALVPRILAQLMRREPKEFLSGLRECIERGFAIAHEV